MLSVDQKLNWLMYSINSYVAHCTTLNHSNIYMTQLPKSTPLKPLYFLQRENYAPDFEPNFLSSLISYLQYLLFENFAKGMWIYVCPDRLNIGKQYNSKIWAILVFDANLKK